MCSQSREWLLILTLEIDDALWNEVSNTLLRFDRIPTPTVSAPTSSPSVSINAGATDGSAPLNNTIEGPDILVGGSSY